MSKGRRSLVSAGQSAVAAASVITKAQSTVTDPAALARQDEAKRLLAIATVQNDFAPSEIKWRQKPTRLVLVPFAIELAQTILAHGLAQPIAVDKHLTLVAGGHRLFAHLLITTPPAERLFLIASLPNQVEPVRPEAAQAVADQLAQLPFRPDFRIKAHRMEQVDAVKDADLALEIEIVENEKRRDYTAVEVRNLAKTLEEKGYSFKRGRREVDGRAISGQRVLELVTGKSASTVYRLLHSDEATTKHPPLRPRLPVSALLTWVAEAQEGDSLKSLRQAIDRRLQQIGI